MSRRCELTGKAVLVGNLVSQLKDGKIKVLALTASHRWPQMPDIPTFAEAGFGGYPAGPIYWGVVVPTGTPAPIVTHLDDEIGTALALPDVRDTFAKLGVEIFHLNPVQLGAFLHAEAARFDSLLEHARVKRAAP